MKKKKRKAGGDRKRSRTWGWQYVFPLSSLSTDPRSNAVRRHHIDPSADFHPCASARRTGVPSPLEDLEVQAKAE